MPDEAAHTSPPTPPAPASTGSPPAPNPASQSPAAGQALSFELLGQGQNEVLIAYRGQLYRLRATRNGKLILNK